MRGIYIVSESACLNPNTGAGKHIEVGMRELNRVFNMELLLFCTQPSLNVHSGHVGRVSSVTVKKRSALYLFFKWVYVLISNHAKFFHHFSAIRRKKPDFIYERSSYLNFNGILISWLLGIPHMYEVNGILADDNRSIYPGLCYKFSRLLEKFIYSRTFGFYVGGINEELNINRKKALIIQNGVDKHFADKFMVRQNIASEKIEVAFIGHAMEHHRLDILAEALNLLQDRTPFRLHLIGNHLESLLPLLPKDLETILHGSLSHDGIAELSCKLNIGVIPYTKDYFSHVKLFTYGAARLAVIVPHSRNYDKLFNDDEIMYMLTPDAKGLKDRLEFVASNRHKIGLFGDRLYERICNDFTWEHIYKTVSDKIREQINGRSLSLHAN